MKKQAVILAGGFGTRLQHIVSNVPKPMAPIANKPFLDYQIKLLRENGFNDFILLTGYKSSIIENYYSRDLNIRCIREDTPLGTGGAVLNAWPLLADSFYVINGDTFFDADFSILDEFGNDKPALIALHYSTDISRYGLVNIDNNFKITQFIEKGSLPNTILDGYINGGIYKFNKNCLTPIRTTFKNDNISMESQIFPKMLANHDLYGLPVGGAFIDIGVPDDYLRAQTYIPNTIIKERTPALFTDKDGTIIKDTGYPHGSTVQIIPETIDTISKYYHAGYKIIMVTNQAGIAKNKFTLSSMLENIETITEIYKRYGIVFSDIEYCPYHIDATIPEYKYKSIARKPYPGMILRACDKHRLDLKRSVMLGDNPNVDRIKLPYLKSVLIKER